MLLADAVVASADETNKFLLYDLEQGGFVGQFLQCDTDHDLQKAAIFSTNSLLTANGYDPDDGNKYIDVNWDEAGMCSQLRVSPRYLQFPLTQAFVDALPFSLADTDPHTPHSTSYDNTEALKGDFVVLTDYGFYDEKYNASTESSRPKVRSFDLDHANLYNMEQLEEQGTTYILDAVDKIPPMIVPVSEAQQALLQDIPAFSSEQEPHGFFMQPIGPSEVSQFNEALIALGIGEINDEDDQDFAASVEALQEDFSLDM